MSEEDYDQNKPERLSFFNPKCWDSWEKIYINLKWIFVPLSFIGLLGLTAYYTWDDIHSNIDSILSGFEEGTDYHDSRAERARLKQELKDNIDPETIEQYKNSRK